jgi:serine/threonine protein kinase
MDDHVGLVFGNYRVEDLLGSGGMGRVYRGVHQHLDWVAAVKVMHAHLSVDPAFRARFHREALTTARLKHPNIIALLDFGEQDGALYLIMELVNDGSLRTLLRERDTPARGWSLDLGLDLVRQAALGLDFAHAQGALHRDIKPDNLLLSTEPDAAGTSRTLTKITDFGLAHLLDGSALTASGAMVGTPAYMSPEQCQGHTLDARTDIYSLGVVLYEVATRRLPFTTRTISDAVYHHVFVPPPPPETASEALPPGLDAIIMRCLAKQPAQRFTTAGELAAALDAIRATPAIPEITNASSPETTIASTPPLVLTPTPAPQGEPAPPTVAAHTASATAPRRPSLALLALGALTLLLVAVTVAVVMLLSGRGSDGDNPQAGMPATAEAGASDTPTLPAAFARDAEHIIAVVQQPDFAPLLGAPWDAPQSAVIRFQEFERGIMLVMDNVPDDGGVLAAITAGDGRGYYQRFAPDEVENAPEVQATATPTDDGQQPDAPFDRLLAATPELQAALGVPVQGSGGRAVFQQFEHGLALSLSQTERVWLFYADSPTASDGEWEVVWLPLAPHPIDLAYGTQQIEQVVQNDTVREALGQALGEARAVSFPAQEFERGLIVETSFLADVLSELDAAALVLTQFGSQTNGSYQLVTLDDYDWAPPPDESPPAERFPAIYPFSLVWGNEPEVRSALRWALGGDAHAAGVVQHFERGVALWIEETYRVWIIYESDGDVSGSYWEAYPVS